MKKLYLLLAGAAVSSSAFAQGAVDAFRLSQPDMKGTARYMGMAGAFGALGGDLSTLSQNPGGIGVYRNSEIGITFDLDCQSSESKTNMGSFKEDRTKFLVNNVGAVWTMKLNSSAVPNINIGFTYNKAASFSRRYKGGMNLRNSLSNYIAALSNASGVTEDQVSVDDGSPYYSSAPWISSLAFQSYLMSPYYATGSSVPDWEGQWVNGQTSGIGSFDVQESGGVDEYNIAIGGNINNVVFWGMDFGITTLSYKETSEWGENLNNALVNGGMVDNNQFRYGNRYSAWGTGFNYKIGVIVKPIQELRLGLAVHTPTWYNMNESYIGGVQFLDPQYNWQPKTVETNDGVRGSDSFNFRTPMKLIASVAGVIANRLIISADYEWQPFNKMHFSEASADYGWYDDGWYDDYYWGDIYMRPAPEDPKTRSGVFESTDAFYNSNQEIKSYYRSQNTLRLGAEFRVTSRFSVRAGYSFVSSPTSVKAYDNNTEIFTAGTLTNYRFNDVTNYVTCGLGYKAGPFYADLAYVYKHISGNFHPYPTDADGSAASTPKADLGLTNNQIFLSLGFKF
ncbi:MAG: hypothetical protein HDS31_07795 [Bacteroides sp.]|nr:hypothetical protein [Bacteroides sp.]